MADAIGLGRALLADADWVNKARVGKDDDIRPCMGCNNGCVSRANNGRNILCAVNANLFCSELTPSANTKKVCVVGGGIAGMEAARVAALRGHTVQLYEKNSKLGGSLIPGSVPEFKDADRRLLDWYTNQLNNAGVEIHLNTELTLQQLESMNVDEVVVGTGAVEKSLPIPGADQDHVMSSIEALTSVKAVGNRVVIIGGGQVGCELALWLKGQGKEVAIVEALDGLLQAGSEPIPMANMFMLNDLLAYNKIPVHLSSKVHSIDKNQVSITNLSGDETIPADTVVLAIGFQANDKLYKEIASHMPVKVSIVGDAQRPSNVLYAVRDGYAAGKKI